MASSFEQAGLDLIRKAEVGLYDAAVEVMKASLKECPLSGPDTYGNLVGDNGTLRRSAVVAEPTRTGDGSSVVIGYGFGEEENPRGMKAAEYAVPVHERAELRHDPPTKSHFLQDPLLEAADRVGPFLAEAIRSGDVHPTPVMRGTADGDLAAE